MNNPNKTASPQGPDPEAPDGLNAYTPDPGELSPDLHASERRESKPSVTQNPMTPRVSEPGPDRRTPTSPIHPDDPIPWSGGQDVQRANPYDAKSDGSTKPASQPKSSRSRREVKQTPPTQHR